MRQKLERGHEEMPRIAIDLDLEAVQHESMRERIERVRDEPNRQSLCFQGTLHAPHRRNVNI
jgi:hypothetical protein